VVALALLPAPLRAQQLLDLDRPPVLPDSADLRLLAGTPSSSSASRSSRIRLFRFEPGFLTDPLGVEDDPPTGDPTAWMTTPPPPPPPEADTGPDWIQVAIGSDNPYFDFRQRGDPGGLGFYRVCTQVQLFDNGSTGCALGLEAVTPAGQEFAGVENGSTVVKPKLGVFHALDDGTAVQGFVGKNVRVKDNGDSRPLEHNLEYGMAVQRPVANDGPDSLRNLYFYVGALGQYNMDRDTSRPPSVWEVLPGLHWKVADNWWMSGGVILPVGPTRTDSAGHWQFTCSLQF
jgi:hypothetical protein